MFIAMNRFKIVPGKEDVFESIWKERDSHLEGVIGFKNFHLIKGKKESEFTLTPPIVLGRQRQHF